MHDAADPDPKFDSSYDHIPGVPLRDDRFREPQRVFPQRPFPQEIIVTNNTAVDEPEIGQWHYDEVQQVFSSPLYVNVDVNDLIQDHSEEKAYEILGKLKDLFS